MSEPVNAIGGDDVHEAFANQDVVADKIDLLAIAGPALGRPHADAVRSLRAD